MEQLLTALFVKIALFVKMKIRGSPPVLPVDHPVPLTQQGFPLDSSGSTGTTGWAQIFTALLNFLLHFHL